MTDEHCMGGTQDCDGDTYVLEIRTDDGISVAKQCAECKETFERWKWEDEAAVGVFRPDGKVDLLLDQSEDLKHVEKLQQVFPNMEEK